MNSHNIYLYIFVMALVTYLIRALPLTLIRKKITNRFLRSFLYYMPYATLSAMTVPAIFYQTPHFLSGLLSFIVGLAAAFCKKSLLLVAALCCITVYVSELLIAFFI